MVSQCKGKASLFDLYPKDREAMSVIRERLDLNSNALCVRIALRQLAKQLNDPTRLGDPEKAAQENEHHG